MEYMELHIEVQPQPALKAMGYLAKEGMDQMVITMEYMEC